MPTHQEVIEGLVAQNERLRDQRDYLFDVVGTLLHHLYEDAYKPGYLQQYSPLYKHFCNALDELRLDDDDDGPSAATRRYLDRLNPAWRIDDDELPSERRPIGA